MDASTSLQEIERVVGQLRECLGAQNVLTSSADMEPFLRDWRGRHVGAATCVALPASTQEVSAAMRACHAARVPVVPQGGNTGLVGAATPDAQVRDGRPLPVVIAMRRMNRILESDVQGETLTVEAGCVLAHVQAVAIELGRTYGVSFGAEGSCQIGGTIATNAGGTAVLKYGTTRSNVLGIEVVLSDGRIWNGLRALRKDNAGYALRELFVGSEGTLGIVTAATLRLHPRPTAHSTAWLTLDTAEQALSCLACLREFAGDRILAFEMINRAQVDNVCRHIPGVRRPADPEAPFAVLAELADVGEAGGLDDLLERAAAEMMERGLLRDVATARTGAAREAMWRLRHGTAESNRKEGMGLSADVAVPLSKVAAFLRQTSERIADAYPTARILCVSHLGDGNVHFTPMFSHADWDSMADRRAVTADIRTRIHDTARSLNGTFSAEHGVGSVLADELSRLRSPLELELMRSVRTALDPLGLLNPGKIF